jgi:hypothetical protein
VGRTKAIWDLRYGINDLNFENSHMLSELLTHNKARYDAAATVRLSNGIAKRWHVMTTLPRLQMLQGEAKTLGSDVRRQLGEVKLERVVEMESSCAELSSLLAEIEAAKLRRAQAEPLQHQTELQQELSAVKMEMEQTLAGQRSKLEVLKKECTRFKLRLSDVQRRLDIEGPVVYYDEQPESGLASAGSRQGSLEEVLLHPGYTPMHIGARSPTASECQGAEGAPQIRPKAGFLIPGPEIDEAMQRLQQCQHRQAQLANFIAASKEELSKEELAAGHAFEASGGLVSVQERENRNGRGTRAAPSLNSGIVFGKTVDVTAEMSHPQNEMQAKDVKAKPGAGGKDQAARQQV